MLYWCEVLFLLCVLSHLPEINSKIQGINKLYFFYFMDEAVEAHRDKEGCLHRQKVTELCQFVV